MIIDKWGHNAHNHHIKEMLGLRYEDKLPSQGMIPRVIQGYTVWVAPLVAGRKRHRIRTNCPRCGKDISVGRIAQHEKLVHKEG